MSTSPVTTATDSSKSIKPKKVLIPKVWKRPHSTIYGKNVEFGSSLYSDKIGELDGRRFNSELPWTIRNSGLTSGASSPGIYNQGYLSSYFDSPSLTAPFTTRHDETSGRICMNSFADLLELTNPSRFSRRNRSKTSGNNTQSTNQRIDFYDRYMDFSKEIDHMNQTSLLNNEPLMTRKVFDDFLDFDYALGLFLPNHDMSRYDDSFDRAKLDNRCMINSNIGRNALGCRLGDAGSGSSSSCSITSGYDRDTKNKMDINTKTFVPFVSTTQQTKLLPKHNCQLMSSPYGQSTDGRKLSLGSINPQSYRPSLPHKTSVTHASDGEEFEFHDRSSPFYTDRWAGRTIRHFDSDLYSNANLFKSMIL